MPSLVFPLLFCLGLSTCKAIAFHICFWILFFCFAISFFPFSSLTCHLLRFSLYAILRTNSKNRIQPCKGLMPYFNASCLCLNYGESISAFSMKTFGLAPHIGHNWQDLVSVKMFKTFPSKSVIWRSYLTDIDFPLTTEQTYEDKSFIWLSKFFFSSRIWSFVYLTNSSLTGLQNLIDWGVRFIQNTFPIWSINFRGIIVVAKSESPESNESQTKKCCL